MTNISNIKIKKEDILKIYSQKLLQEFPEIKNERFICNIEDLLDNINNYEDIKYPHINIKIKLKLNCNTSSTTYSTRECRICDNTNTKTKWICNDAMVVSNKKIYNNQIILSEKKVLYYPNKIPKYSIIIYGSTYKEDFTGGIFEFSDGTKIKPRKNMSILFNSKEAFYIHKVRSGIKKETFVTLY